MKTLAPENSIESLVEFTENYSTTTLKLFKLQLLEQTSYAATLVMTRLVVAGMYILFSVIVSAGVALWAGDLLGKAYYGFFIVAAFYFIAGVVFHSYLYRWLKKPVSSLLIRQVLH